MISDNGKWLGFFKYPTAADAKKLRKEKKPVQSGVVVVNLATGETREFDKCAASRSRRSSRTGSRSSVMRPKVRRQRGRGSLLVDVRSGTVTSIGNVGEFAFDDAGTRLAWTVEGRDLVGNGVQVRELKTNVVRVLDSDKALYRRLTWADSGLALAVLRGRPDSAAADTAYSVLGYAGFSPAMKAVVFTPPTPAVSRAAFALPRIVRRAGQGIGRPSTSASRRVVRRPRARHLVRT